MALAARQIKVSTRAGGANSATNAFASTILAGSLLVSGCAIFNASGVPEATISDNVNGTWSTNTGFLVTAESVAQVQVNAFPNSAAGTVTVTCNPTGSSADIDLMLFEITGAVTSSPRDVNVTASGTTNSAGGNATVTTGTLAQADEILIAGMSHGDAGATLTQDTADGFTLANENENNSTGQTFLFQYKIVTVTTSLAVDTAYGSAVSGGSPWFTGVTSYKAATTAALAGDEGALWYLLLEEK